MAPCLNWNTETVPVSSGDMFIRPCVNNVKRLHLVSPQTVIKGLDSILGHTVRSAEWGDPPKHAGNIHHPAFGLLDEGKDAECYIDDAAQIDRQHHLVVLNGEPVSWTRRDTNSGIVHHSPQAWSGTSMTRSLAHNHLTSTSPLCSYSTGPIMPKLQEVFGKLI